MREWNKGQQQGIEATGENVLVSASAGAGKTAVLVERLIRRLTDPVSPLGMDRFVFVTFTNAAAQEMLSRVRGGIEERIRLEPGNRDLARQRQLLGQAAISTLHGFCLDLIRRNCKELGIDPKSRVMSEPERLLLRGEILDGFLEACYEANEPGFAALTSVYGGDKTDDPFKRLILRVYDFAEAQPDPLIWLNDSVRIYRETSGGEKLSAFLKEFVGEKLRSIVDGLEEGVELVKRSSVLKKYEDCFMADMEKLLAVSEIADWDELIGAIEASKSLFGRLPVIQTKAGPGEEPDDHEARLRLQSKVKGIREKCKKELLDLFHGLTGESRANLTEELTLMSLPMIALASLTAAFFRTYEKEKQERALLDFGDIEHYAFRLLLDGEGKASDLALTLRERYEEILVDEYQDINPVQEAILQALRGKSLYMVGDVKQSIYGFRQAAPGLFLDKFRRYGAGRDGLLVPLDESYRGSRLVAEGINQVFDLCMTRESCGIDYSKEGRLISAIQTPAEGEPETDRKSGRGALELHLIDLSDGEGREAEQTEAPEADGDEDGDVRPEPGALQAEAAFCAWRIEKLMSEELWDRGRGMKRPMKYGDIVILMSAVKGVADAFIQALQARGIPVYADTGTGYIQTQEIQTALSFLKVLDNPRQDIPLAALMLSTAFGFTPEGLGRIRTAYGRYGRRGQGGGLYRALVFAAAGKNLPEGKELRKFLKTLKEYRLYARHASVADVLARFYEDTGFLTISSAMAGGIQRRANLLALVQRAREFEDTNLQGLYQFIQYLEAIEKEGAELAPAPVIGEGENVVRIMSIHKSKGLEFPVVILATAGRGFNMKDSQNDLLLHGSWGMAAKVVIPELRVRYPGAYHILAAAGIRRDLTAEQQRLLYVALTRAEQRVIVISSDKKGRQRYDAWSEEEYGGRRAAYQAGSFMDWLGPAVIGGRDNTPWVSKLWTADQVFVPLEKKREDNELWQAVLTMTEPDNEESEWGFIGRRLEWRYARKRAGELNAKLSVTQAKGRLYPDEDTGAAKALYVETKEIYAPRMEGPRYLAGDQSLTPGERGTLLHKVLARIEPYETRRAMDERKEQGMGDRAAVEACLDDLLRRLTTDEFITPAEEEQVDKERLIPFLLSELFQRIASADARGECRREASFFMAVPAGRVYAELSEGSSDPGGLASGFEEDEVIVQGTVDVFFVEGDGLVLADYKSDRIEPGGEAELLRRYRGQLLLYAEGLEAFTGRKVTEMLLYSLALGKEIPLNPITG